MDKKQSVFLEMAKTAVFALLIVLFVRYFLFQPFIVRGASMEPSFHETDYLIVDQISFRFREPERGEVVVFRYPNDPSKRHIKRIIGLPGEKVTVSGGSVYIEGDGEKLLLQENYLYLPKAQDDNFLELGEEEYFVMGDNRGASFDSRNWGALPRENIVGKVSFQVSFFDVFARVPLPNY